MQFLLQRGPLLLAGLLAALMAGTLSWEGYLFWKDLQSTPRQPHPSAQAAGQRSTRPDVNLAKLQLFGNPTRQAPQKLETAKLPETNLRLVLRGVMATDEEAPASALVEGPDQETQTYSVDADLPGGARLQAIYPDRIVIERGGRLENLYFPKDAEDSGIERYSAAEEVASEPEPAYNTQQSVSTQQTQPAHADISEERKAEIRARLDKLRERLRANY
ncbi:type II secretion system protein N [Marinobacteraceae bacterium S3BR75-40.1]